MATTALPRHRIHRRDRFRSQWNSGELGWGTLMRHFLVSGPIPALTFGVRVTSPTTRLIAATGGLDGSASCLIGTPGGAVALTPITVTTNDHGGAATRTQVAPSGEIHGQRSANGGRQQRPLRGILCMQRCPSGQRGAASELAWRLGPLSRRHLHRLRCFYRIGSIGATASFNTTLHRPAALLLPDGSLLRKPPAGSPAGSRLKPQ